MAFSARTGTTVWPVHTIVVDGKLKYLLLIVGQLNAQGWMNMQSIASVQWRVLCEGKMQVANRFHLLCGLYYLTMLPNFKLMFVFDRTTSSRAYSGCLPKRKAFETRINTVRIECVFFCWFCFENRTMAITQIWPARLEINNDRFKTPQLLKHMC